MRIEVNGKIYRDSHWQFDNARGTAVLTLFTNEQISTVALDFDSDNTVTAYDDNNNVTGIWYVHNILGIYENYESRTSEEPREVIVDMKASALATEAEERLNSSIDENMDAILELGELIANLRDADTRINNIEGIINGFPRDIVERFGEIDNMYSKLADRIATLENKMEGS